MFSYPEDGEPHINWYHVDGPLLICSDGTPHWLTIVESFLIKVGFTDIKKLDEKYKIESEE